MYKSLYKYTKKQIKQAFPKYKRVQVGATIKEVIVKRKEKRVQLSMCGDGCFSYKVETEEKLPMVEFKRVFIS